MKRALILGASGFVGGYLTRHLLDCGEYEVFVTKTPQEQMDSQGAELLDLDILDAAAVTALLREIRPDHIYYLAAQSSVALSWRNPELTVDVNIKGCLHLLEAVRALELPCRILLVGSGEEYGQMNGADMPVNERHPVSPANIYAVTKVCQNLLGGLYAGAYGMDAVMVRAFNHIGPRQAPSFVVSDFCRQAAVIEQGGAPPVIRVGNLSAKRDFTDVRDVVRAYELLMRLGKKGETYNVGSGKAVPIQDILNMILAKAAVPIEVQTDPERFRPLDVPIIEADIEKLRGATGFAPQIQLEQSVEDILIYWREHI